jgi:hypothetical protein
MPRLTPVLVLLALCLPSLAAETQNLAGDWRFKLDPDKQGLEARWFASPLATAEPATIKLPGTTDEAKAGRPNPKKPTLEGLWRPNTYVGAAWYQRDFDLPEAWRHKRLSLFAERVHWVSRVWLDGADCGSAESLVAPHVHDLGGELAPGRHTLTLMLDNTPLHDMGYFVSVLYEGTQTNWHGVVGRLELQAVDAVSLGEVQVYPEPDQGAARVVAQVVNRGAQPVTAQVDFSDTGGAGSTGKTVTAGPGASLIEAQVPLPAGAGTWDEFQPRLRRMRVVLAAGDSRDERTVSFGARNLATKGTQFTMNGRPLLLRGTLECGIFPKTGYPPCDVAFWRHIFGVIKSYGLNFMRFHSWCPPDEAFEAADLEGVMIQAEGPMANVNAGEPARDAFVEQEFLRMVRTYGNHPSFCLMTLGNEYGGPDAILSRWIDELRAADPRHLYASPSCGQPTANRQWTEDAVRGVRGPDTAHDFGDHMRRQDRPVVGHEIGQWMFFPNFDEMPKYDGVLKPENFRLIREDLERKGLADQAKAFGQSMGLQSVALYKEEIEVIRRTPGYSGFSLLDLHDYPGQGTALIGILDPFWDSKGFVAPEVHRQYCGPTVPLARFAKREWLSDETFEASVDLSQFGPTDLKGAKAAWRLADAGGAEVAAGSLDPRDVPTGTLAPLGKITASLAAAKAPAKLTLTVAIEGTEARNSWDLWVYPNAAAPAPPAGLTVVPRWGDEAKAALAAGGAVALLPAKPAFAQSLKGSSLPVFWSPVWFPSQQPNANGILCDPRHPLFRQFPTESWSNWQWWDLQARSRSLILDDTPPTFRPLVQIVDNFARNHKLGVMFEAKVGTGRLFVSSLDLVTDLEHRPVARQLLTSLYAYLGSADFKPAAELDAATLDKVLAPPIEGLMKRLGAKVLRADSQCDEHEPAKAIDGDPDSSWHTAWQGDFPDYPHEIVIEFPQSVAMSGVKVLPRQDMANAQIRDFEVYVSADGADWGRPAAKGRFPEGQDLHLVTFAHRLDGRFLKVVGLNGWRDEKFAAIAEIEIIPAPDNPPGPLASAGLLKQLGGRLVSFDSQAEGYEAAKAIDGDDATFWHTPWGDAATPFPHELVLSFPQKVKLGGIRCLPRQDGNSNGWIKGWAVYASADGKAWGQPLAKGEFQQTADPQVARFGQPIETQWLKFEALSGFTDDPFASLAEFDVLAP